MSVSAKQTLIKVLEERLGDVVTVNQLKEITDALNIELANYEVESVERAEADTDAEYFLDAFLSAKMLEGKSAGTLKLYRSLLTRFFENVHAPVRQITVFHLRAHLQREKERGISDKTLEGQRAIFCSFFGWCHKEGLLPSNPCSNLSPIKVPKVVRLPFTDVEIERLRDACTCTRDKAIMMFLLTTGCRISEVTALNRDDVDFKNGRAVVFGKGAKERQVYLTDVASMYLEQYLNERTDNSPALFASRSSERITPNGIRKMLHVASGATGVENVHPHRFRRTLATNLIDNGMPIQEVAAVLGHDKLDTTMTYVYMSNDNIQNDYKKYA